MIFGFIIMIFNRPTEILASLPLHTSIHGKPITMKAWHLSGASFLPELGDDKNAVLFQILARYRQRFGS
jgi:hypothetical protein